MSIIKYFVIIQFQVLYLKNCCKFLQQYQKNAGSGIFIIKIYSNNKINSNKSIYKIKKIIES